MQCGMFSLSVLFWVYIDGPHCCSELNPVQISYIFQNPPKETSSLLRIYTLSTNQSGIIRDKCEITVDRNIYICPKLQPQIFWTELDLNSSGLKLPHSLQYNPTSARNLYKLQQFYRSEFLSPFLSSLSKQDLFSSPSQKSCGAFSHSDNSFPWKFCLTLFFTWYKAADEGTMLSLPPLLVTTQTDSKCVWYWCGLLTPCYLQLLNTFVSYFSCTWLHEEWSFYHCLC